MMVAVFVIHLLGAAMLLTIGLQGSPSKDLADDRVFRLLAFLLGLAMVGVTLFSVMGPVAP